MAELKTNRLTDLSFGNTIDDAMGELEGDIAVILGLETGVNYTSAAVVSMGLMGTESAGVYQGTAYGVATLNASSLVVQDPMNATTSADTAKMVMTKTDWAYIDSSWGGTVSSIATLVAASTSPGSSAVVVQDPRNAVTAPGINKICKADSTTFSGGAYIDPTWVGASLTAGAYKLVRADSTGVIDSAWGGTAWAILSSSQTLSYPIDIGGVGSVQTPATGTRGIVCTVKNIAGTGISLGDICRLDTSDGKVRKAKADAASTGTGMLVLALSAIASDAEGSALLFGFTDIQFGLGSGQLMYLSSTTAGDVVATAPTSTGTIVRLLGYSLGNQGAIFDPDQTWIEL